MYNTHNWSVLNMERRAADDVVERVHWKLDSSDGTNTVTAHNTTEHNDSTSDLNYISYAQLTEEDVLEWVWSEVSKSGKENDNDLHLLELSSPAAIHGLPW